MYTIQILCFINSRLELQDFEKQKDVPWIPIRETLHVYYTLWFPFLYNLCTPV